MKFQWLRNAVNGAGSQTVIKTDKTSDVDLLLPGKRCLTPLQDEYYSFNNESVKVKIFRSF